MGTLRAQFGDTGEMEVIGALYKGLNLLSEQRRGGADRGRVSDLLDKAENDPLRFHNLSGVSPYDILAIIDQQYERQVNYEALSKKLRSLSEREADAKQLRKAVRMLKCYKPLLIDRWWPVTDMFGRLESFAEILDDKELKGLVPPWNLDPKGPRAKNELSEITREMMELVEEQKKCLEHLATGKVDKSRLLDVTTGAKAQWGSVTAVLMAAFPQWFSRKIDPIRNVKIAFKRFPKYSEPVDEDM